ncbi:unnamed protein product [Schistosoma spindalis]|nr:unnamed protein product [Schistosoma spindale]
MNMKFIILTIIVIFTSLLIYGYNAEKAQCGSVSCDVGETFLHERYCCKDLLNRDDCCKKIRPLLKTWKYWTTVSSYCETSSTVRIHDPTLRDLKLRTYQSHVWALNN